LPQRDHFEIKEFNIELCDGTTNEESSSLNGSEVFSGGKPYPVYPGKGSLQPKTIEFCIQRYILSQMFKDHYLEGFLVLICSMISVSLMPLFEFKIATINSERVLFCCADFYLR
jgi:hypothetical protein